MAEIEPPTLSPEWGAQFLHRPEGDQARRSARSAYKACLDLPTGARDRVGCENVAKDP